MFTARYEVNLYVIRLISYHSSGSWWPVFHSRSLGSNLILAHEVRVDRVAVGQYFGFLCQNQSTNAYLQLYVALSRTTNGRSLEEFHFRKTGSAGRKSSCTFSHLEGLIMHHDIKRSVYIEQ